MRPHGLPFTESEPEVLSNVDCSESFGQFADMQHLRFTSFPGEHPARSGR